MEVVKPIEFLGDRIRIIDQRKLPSKLEYIEITRHEEMVEAIKTLAIRGAPLLGIASAYGVIIDIIRADENTPKENLKALFEKAYNDIYHSRPTAYNLFWALSEMKKVFEENIDKDINTLKEELKRKAIEIHEEDRKLCEKIGENGVKLIEDMGLVKKGGRRLNILTHCNTGALATGGIGTALAVIYKAFEKGYVNEVFVDETRPLLQGARLTTWELLQAGIPTVLNTDNMAGVLMQQQKIDFVIVGADRIAMNGDTANKIGTYTLAILARYHNIPFFVAAPSTTFDPNINTGAEIPIEYRKPEEVKSVLGCKIAPEEVKAYNPAFDITPSKLISAFITEKGVIFPPFQKNIKEILGL